MVEVLSFPCLAYCVEGYLVVAPALTRGLHRLADFHGFGEVGDECVDVGPDRSVWVEREGDSFHWLLPFVFAPQSYAKSVTAATASAFFVFLLSYFSLFSLPLQVQFSYNDRPLKRPQRASA